MLPTSRKPRVRGWPVLCVRPRAEGAAAGSWGLESSCERHPAPVLALLETGTACKEQGFHRMQDLKELLCFRISLSVVCVAGLDHSG